MNAADPDPLEKKIHEALRALPHRRAPASIEARVLAEIARRDALPWWKRSWSYWPAAVRWLFLVVSAALCGTAIAGGMAFFQGGFRSALGTVAIGPMQVASELVASGHALLVAFHQMVALVPAPWFYGVIGGIVFLYLVFFAVGAGVYRLVWKNS